MSRFVIQAMSKGPPAKPGGTKKEDQNGISKTEEGQPKQISASRSALTSALSQQKNAAQEVGSGRLETILSEPSSSLSSDTAVSSPPRQQLCPPDAFPCLYYHETTEEVDASPFEEDSLAVSLRVGTPINEWSLGRSAGSSLSRSLGGSFLGRDESGTPVADYEENPFSRRAAEFVPSPAHNNARWNALGSPSIEANYLTEAVVGSLPKAMTPSERTRMTSRLGASPSLKTMKDIPEERISARSIEGRALRRRLLKGRVLVFITAGYSGKRFIYERIKELGVRAVMIDGPESWSRILEDEGVLEKFVPFDWSDQDTVFERCLEVCKRVEQELGQVDGVVSFWEIAQPLVARLAEKLGLPGNLPDSVDAAREKQRTRSIMAEAGLPTPKNLLISGFEDLPKAAKHVGFPAVIKPISGAASLGVVRVDDYAALETTYKRAMAEMGAIRLDKDGNFVSADSDLAVKEQTSAAGTNYVASLFIMEQYLDGPEVDVDIVLSKGEAVYGSITDNWPTIEPYFNETGSNCPSILPIDQQKALCELSVQAVKALGFTLGAFHVEGKYTSHGPHIIEVNARMGGGPVRDINKIVYGVDLIEEHLLAAAGIPTKPLVAKKPLKHIAEYSVCAKKTGVLLTKDYLQDWVDQPDVLYIRALVDEGQKVVCVEDGMPTWMYEMMVTKPTVEEAIEYIKSIEEAVEVPIAKITALK